MFYYVFLYENTALIASSNIEYEFVSGMMANRFTITEDIYTQACNIIHTAPRTEIRYDSYVLSLHVGDTLALILFQKTASKEANNIICTNVVIGGRDEIDRMMSYRRHPLDCVIQ